MRFHYVIQFVFKEETERMVIISVHLVCFLVT